jgi:hypothetical protein
VRFRLGPYSSTEWAITLIIATKHQEQLEVGFEFAYWHLDPPKECLHSICSPLFPQLSLVFDPLTFQFPWKSALLRHCYFVLD